MCVCVHLFFRGDGNHSYVTNVKYLTERTDLDCENNGTASVNRGLFSATETTRCVSVPRRISDLKEC